MSSFTANLKKKLIDIYLGNDSNPCKWTVMPNPDKPGYVLAKQELDKNENPVWVPRGESAGYPSLWQAQDALNAVVAEEMADRILNLPEFKNQSAAFEKQYDPIEINRDVVSTLTDQIEEIVGKPTTEEKKKEYSTVANWLFAFRGEAVKQQLSSTGVFYKKDGTDISKSELIKRVHAGAFGDIKSLQDIFAVVLKDGADRSEIVEKMRTIFNTRTSIHAVSADAIKPGDRVIVKPIDEEFEGVINSIEHYEDKVLIRMLVNGRIIRCTHGDESPAWLI